MNKGKLYLIPNVISDTTLPDDVIPHHVRLALSGIRHFLVEDVRTARRYLSSLKIYESIEALDFQSLNKDTSPDDLHVLLDPVFRGINIGIISDAGCPGIADPGALAVMHAHKNGIPVVPLVGPSSILLALMASGLNGQQFAFRGYLPIDPKECSKAIQALEHESRQKNQTQIFIETPYRNNQLKEMLIRNLRNETMLSISQDLTGPGETITTFSVKQWKAITMNMPKAPSIFLFLSF
jgi:16S rRNA (cytidine1402-2'-O)-methyltransferase